MKKFLQTLVLAVAILLPWAMNAQNQVDTVVIGNGTSTGYNTPMTNYYEYGWTEQRYAGSEVGHLGLITNIAFYCGQSASLTFDDLRIYMGTTPSATLSSTSDWTPESNLTLVYSGTSVTVGAATGWQDFVLTTPFMYTDTNQALVVVVAKGQSGYSSTQKWTYTSVTNSAMYRQSDGQTAYAQHPGTNTGSRVAYRPNIQLVIEQADLSNFCFAPSNLTVSNIQPYTADFSWSPATNSTGYNVAIGVSGVDFDTIVPDFVTDTFTSFTNLSANTPYICKVQSVCSDSSAWMSTSFRTPCVDIDQLPWVENFESYSNSERPSCWTSGGYSTYPYVSTNSNNKYLYLYNNYSSYNTTNNPTYACLPPFDTLTYPMNTIQLSLDAMSTSTSTGADYPRTIIVGVCTVAGDLSTFTAVDTLSNLPSTLTNYLINFNGYQGNGNNITLVSDASMVTGSYGYNYVGVDNVQIRLIPDCPQPSALSVEAAVADSVVVAWNEEGQASEWELAVGPTGFSLDSITEFVSALADTVVLTDLTAGVTYDVYVRAICTDESYWTGPVTFTPGSYIMSATGTASISMCGGVIYDDGGINGDYSANCNSTLTINPSSADSMVVLTVHLAGTESCCDHLYIYDGTSSVGTPVYSSDGVAGTYGPFISTTGSMTIRFTSDGSVQSAGFAVNVNCVAAPECSGIQNLEVSHIAGTSAYASWELQNENLGEPEGFTLQLVDLDNQSTTTLTTTENYTLLTGLTPTTNYRLIVQTVCGSITSEADSVNFVTPCLAGGNIEISDATLGGNAVSNYTIPVNNFYGYTISDQIVLSSELNGAGPISSISFEYNGSAASTVKDDCYIYLAHTSATAIAGLPSDRSSYQLVYTGAMNFSANAGWVTITFDSIFNYNGTDNLVVCVLDQSGDYDGTTSTFKTHTTTTPMTRCYFADSGVPTLATAATTSYSYRSNMRLQFPCDSTASCVAPNAVITSVGSDSVSMIWAAGNGETSWQLAHKTVTDSVWTIDETAWTSTEYAFSNLTPAVDYQFRVSHDCDNETYASVCSASTVCVPVSVPITENFQNWATGSLTGTATPACWNRLNNMSTTTVYPYVSTYLGAKAMYMYGSTSGTSCLVLPGVAAAIDSLQVSFQLAYSSTTYGVVLGVMTDPTDLSTFTPVSQHTVAQTGVWNNYEVSLASYHGTGKYIAFMPISGQYNYCYLTNIEVNYIPSCPRPTNVVVSNISATGATVAWTDTTATDFEVEYGPYGFTHGTGTVVSVSNADSVALTGLAHSTTYQVFVRGLCSASDTSYWSFATSFTTSCGLIDNLPITQTFEGLTASTSVHAPNCWTAGSTYSSTYPYVSTSYNHTPNGANGMYFYTSSSGYTYLMLPELDSNYASVNQTEILFSLYGSTSSYTKAIVVGVCENGDASTFVPVDTAVATYQQWTNFEIFLDGYTGTGKNVCLMCKTMGSDSYTYLYLDDITYQMIPSCVHPSHLTASNATSNSIDLSWADHGTTTPAAYQIEYGAPGFTLGTGTQVIATSNPFTLAGLAPAYQGEYYVRGICGAGDTSAWSSEGCLFNTSQLPATVPYTYDFENATEWANWQQTTNASSNVHWARGTVASSTLGTGSYGMYCTNDDSTAAYIANVTNCAIYRDVDFGTNDSSFIIGFDAYMGGSTVNRFDGLMVFLVDPSAPAVSSESAITSPWGNVNNLYRIANVRYTDLENNGWTHFEGIFDNLSGIHRVAFFWFHQGSTTNFVGDMAMVDNISINYAACPRPTDVNITPGSTSANLTWNGPASAEYQVIYRPYPNGTANTFATTYTNNITLTGLTSLTQYAVWVRKVCGSDTSLNSDGQLFVTTMCDGAVSVENWDSTMSASTSSYFPGYATYNYSFCEVIIDSATLAAAGIVGDISAMEYNPTTTTSNTYYEHCDVYMANVDATDLSSDFIVVDSSWTQVLNDADFSFDATGWQTRGFDTVFTWDGHSNVIIAVNRRHGSWSSSTSFASHSHSDQVGRYIYNDGSAYDPTDVSGGYATNNVADYRLISCGAGCATPALAATTNVDYAQATINWTSAATEFEVALLNNGTWTDETSVNNALSYTFTNLAPATTYQYRVRAICDAAEGNVSEWALGTFLTDSLPCMKPVNLEATNIQGTSVSLTWTPQSTESQWMAIVWNTTMADSTVVTATTANFTNLLAGVEYHAAVKAICGNGAVQSDWSDTISFTTIECEPVTGVQATNLTQNSATISWTNNAQGATQWRVEYGEAGYATGEETVVMVSQNPYTINGLDANTQYEVNVTAICGDQWISVPSSSVTFSTEAVGIESVDGINVTIYPNPAQGMTTISLTGVEGQVELTIVDMSGRRVMSETVECASADCVKTINVESLAQGAYFVRINGENTNMVKKLIVK